MARMRITIYTVGFKLTSQGQSVSHKLIDCKYLQDDWLSICINTDNQISPAWSRSQSLSQDISGSRGLKWFWHKNPCARSGPRSGQCRGPMRLQCSESLPSLTFSRFGFKQFPAQHGLSTVRSGACIFLMKKFLLVRIMRRRMSSRNEGENFSIQ